MELAPSPWDRAPAARKSGPGGSGWWTTPGGIRSKYQESSRYLRREQYEYNLNRSFVAGQQWLYFDTARNTINQLPRDPARTRVTMNRLKPASRHIIAKVLSRELNFEVPPSDSDDATMRGAQLAKSVMLDLHREHNWELLREETAWNLWYGGTGLLAVDWDPEAGQPLGQTQAGRHFGTGDLRETALSILEVAWEPGIRDVEHSWWWMRAQALPPSEVQMTYGLDSPPQADVQGALTPLSQRLTRFDKTDVPVDMTLVLTVYMRPSKHSPKGFVATLVGDKFVDGPKPWPFPWKDRLNVVAFRETKVPGRATGDTILSDAVPVQAAYNASWSNIIEHLKLAGNARLMVPESALDGIDEFTDLPGEIVPYNPSGGKPEWLAPASMQPWVIDQPIRIADQMDDILGLHDVSQGKAPRNVQSGVGISVLVEQDSGPIGAMSREMAYGFERFGKLCLELYQAKVTEPRKAHVTMPGQKIPETITWDGKALEGQTTVDVPLDDVLPRNRTAMLAFARELWDRQIIKDADTFARVADLPDQDYLLEAADPDAAKAMAENHLMSIGQVEEPEDFDNHATHITRHNFFRKSKRYRTMSMELRAIIDTHINAHETLAAEQAGAMVQKANIHPALAGVPTAGEAVLPGGIPAPTPPGMPPGPGPDAASGGALYAQPMNPIEPREDRQTDLPGLGALGGGAGI